MAHVPHLLVPGPWDGEQIEPDQSQHRHLVEVLRRSDGAEVSYTDGEGRRGIGIWTDGTIRRGSEHVDEARLATLTLAVAPPDSKERVRWLVEKATELGVSRVRWLKTTYGQGRLPQPDRARSWMVAAVQQSRRSFVTEIDDSWTTLEELGDVSVAEQGGAQLQPMRRSTVAIGPEGGWAPGEINGYLPRVSLGEGVLRTETAAIAVAAVFATAVRS